ncbi:MAG: membrane dipeptidase, partial [Bacteroidota bacterium]
GGVIQINFGSTFLDGEIQKQRNELRAKMMKILNEKGLSFRSEEGRAEIEKFQKANPALFSDVQKVADHIDHVVKIAGVDHVGFGSDYDGVGDSLPTGLKDVSQYPNLIAELLRRGYTESDIEKICYKNVFRVWQAVEDFAAEMN